VTIPNAASLSKITQIFTTCWPSRATARRAGVFSRHFSAAYRYSDHARHGHSAARYSTEWRCALYAGWLHLRPQHPRAPSTTAPTRKHRVTPDGNRLCHCVASGLADVLGIGTHSQPANFPVFGAWQAVGFGIGLVVIIVGILLYAQKYSPNPEANNKRQIDPNAQ
jgi:hypothetical protein